MLDEAADALDTRTSLSFSCARASLALISDFSNHRAACVRRLLRLSSSFPYHREARLIAWAFTYQGTYPPAFLRMVQDAIGNAGRFRVALPATTTPPPLGWTSSLVSSAQLSLSVQRSTGSSNASVRRGSSFRLRRSVSTLLLLDGGRSWPSVSHLASTSADRCSSSLDCWARGSITITSTPHLSSSLGLEVLERGP